MRIHKTVGSRGVQDINCALRFLFFVFCCFHRALISILPLKADKALGKKGCRNLQKKQMNGGFRDVL